MTSTIKTLLLFAVAVPGFGLLSNTASAQSYMPHSLSTARRSCVPIVHPTPHYIPGHYEVIRERVRVPGATYRIYVPDQHRRSCITFFGRSPNRFRRGHYEYRQEPDRFEYRNRKVWVPGRYSY
jgi:hypothetical protein